MTDERFWAIVDGLGWDDDQDYDRIKAKLLKDLDMAEAEAMWRKKFSIQNKLAKMVEAKEAELDVDLGLYNDMGADFYDHVVGMGSKFFSSLLEDFSKVVELAKSGDFEEGFGYIFPSKEDYEMLRPEGYRARIESVKESYLKSPGALSDDVAIVLDALNAILEGRKSDLIEMQVDAVQAASNIEEFNIKSALGLIDVSASDARFNRHAVFNILKDAKRFLFADRENHEPSISLRIPLTSGSISLRSKVASKAGTVWWAANFSCVSRLDQETADSLRACTKIALGEYGLMIGEGVMFDCPEVVIKADFSGNIDFKPKKAHYGMSLYGRMSENTAKTVIEFLDRAGF